MDDDSRSQALARLRRIAGQVTGIQRMLEDNRACVDVMVQVAAAQAALAETGRVILSGHVQDCLAEAARSQDPRERRYKIDELASSFSRLLRVDE